MIVKIIAPTSKSLTNRALILASLSKYSSIIFNPLIAEDTLVLVKGLKALGCYIREYKNHFIIHPINPFIPNKSINIKQSGTSARFLASMIILSSKPIHLYSNDRQMQNRSLIPLLNLMIDLFDISYNHTINKFDYIIYPPKNKLIIEYKNITIDKYMNSSQYISSLLLLYSKFDNKLNLKINARIPSQNHITLTKRIIDEIGSLDSFSYEIGSDISNTIPLLFISILKNRILQVKYSSDDICSMNKLKILFSILDIKIDITEKYIKVYPKELDKIYGIYFSGINYSEWVPSLVSFLILINYRSYIYNIGHMEYHESKRITSLISEINKLNTNDDRKIISKVENGLLINPIKVSNHNWISMNSYNDHRLEIGWNIIKEKYQNINIVNRGSIKKTFPNFYDVYKDLGH